MNWIKDIVTGLIEIYNTRNVYEIMYFLEISLIRKELGKGIKGRFFRDMFINEYIYISDTLLEEEEKVIIAHELGHAILHTDLTSSYYTENQLLNKDKIEYEANKFAAELLIPDDLDLSIYDSITMQQLSNLLGVSEELINLKFEPNFHIEDMSMVAEKKIDYKY